MGCQFEFEHTTNKELNEYYNSGELQKELKYKNKKLHGIQKSYYKSGKLYSKEEFKNNVRDGIYKTFFENGKIETYGQYRNDRKVGEWKDFNVKGEKILTVLWKDGKGKYTEYYDKWNISKSGTLNSKEKEIGNWKFYDVDGNISDSLFFVNGKIDGTHFGFKQGFNCFDFYDTGEFINSFCINLKGDTISKMIREGDLNLNTSFHENGNIQLIGYFDNKTDLPVNSWKQFDKKGILTDSIIFQNGKINEVYRFNKIGKIIESEKELNADFESINGEMIVK